MREAPAPRTGWHGGPQAELFAQTRRRLMLVTLALLAALVVGIGITTAIAAETALDSSTDRALENSANATLATLSGELPRANEGEGEGADIAEHAPAAADTFFLVLDPAGAVVADPSRVALPNLPDKTAVTEAASSGRDLRTISRGGVNVRLLTLPIQTREGTVAGYLQSGFILTLHDQQSTALIVSIVLVGLAGLIAAALVTRYVTARALAPIRAAFDGERRFVADASHELRTPVALIRASAEVMDREGLVSGDGRQLTGDILAEADRLDRLVGDLLAIASTQAATLSIKLEPVDLGAIAGDVVRRIQPLAAERDVRVELDPALAPSLPVLGDRDRLAQLVLVLLDNGLRHSPPGGIVTVGLRADGRSAVLTVDDQGPGVPVADRERIFEPFARLSPERAGDGGSGLGLAIARTIATAHAGTIGAGEAPGGGARFTLRVGLREDAAAPP